MIVATIDIGTNTVLLTVADWDGKNLRVLHDDARITRLGQGLNSDLNFMPEAQERALAVLADYKRIADSLGASRITAVGTAAFRKARNADVFIERVKRHAGIGIRVITGEEEARLSYLSAARDFGDSDGLYVLDIGGGSTEVISRAGAVSMELGGVVMSESIVKNDPPTEEEVEEMRTQIARVVSSSMNLRPSTPPPSLVGLAGSVTTLSAIKQGLVTWDGAKVQGSVLTMEDVDGFVTLFRKTTNAEKTAIPGMVKGREDTILCGTLILKSVMEKIGVDRITVSDRGLRFGLIYETPA